MIIIFQETTATFFWKCFWTDLALKKSNTIEINDKRFFKVNEGDSKDVIQEKYFCKLLELNEEKKNLFTIECLFKLAKILNSLEQKEKSLKCCLKRLEMIKYLFGQSHLQTMYAYQVLSFQYSAVKKNAKAAECLKVALEISKSLNGENHKTTLDCYIYLTEEYYNLQEYEKAKESLEDADKTIKRLGNGESLEKAREDIQSFKDKLAKV